MNLDKNSGWVKIIEQAICSMKEEQGLNFYIVGEGIWEMTLICLIRCLFHQCLKFSGDDLLGIEPNHTIIFLHLSL